MFLDNPLHSCTSQQRQKVEKQWSVSSDTQALPQKLLAKETGDEEMKDNNHGFCSETLQNLMIQMPGIAAGEID